MRNSEREIRTEFVYPPIPIRMFDWSAWRDGTEDEHMLTGWGRTKEKAIQDLLNQEAEKNEEEEHDEDELINFRSRDTREETEELGK